jgi:TPR repeat protein
LGGKPRENHCKLVKTSNSVFSLRLGLLHRIQGKPSLAFRFFSIAARQGHPWSCHQLGELYAYGLGTVQDKDEAVRWHLEGMEGGCEDSKFALRELGYRSMDDDDDDDLYMDDQDDDDDDGDDGGGGVYKRDVGVEHEDGCVHSDRQAPGVNN